MKATETIIVREIDTGWIEGWPLMGDGGTQIIEGFGGLR